MSSRHVRATGKAIGKPWHKFPANLPPSSTNGMERIVMPRFKFNGREKAQEWAATQPWFSRVWMGRTYADSRCWIWLLRPER